MNIKKRMNKMEGMRMLGDNDSIDFNVAEIFQCLCVEEFYVFEFIFCRLFHR